MANTTYYGAKYFRDSSNVAEQTIPLPRPGEVRHWDDVVSGFTALLATSDTIKFARLPAGAIPLRMELYVAGDLDTGADTLAVNVGTTADPDLLAAEMVIGTGDSVYIAPVAGAVGTTKVGTALFTQSSAPSSAYDLTIIPTAPATTNSTGTLYGRLYYTAAQTVVDPTNSPAVVTS